MQGTAAHLLGDLQVFLGEGQGLLWAPHGHVCVPQTPACSALTHSAESEGSMPIPYLPATLGGPLGAASTLWHQGSPRDPKPSSTDSVAGQGVLSTVAHALHPQARAPHRFPPAVIPPTKAVSTAELGVAYCIPCTVGG